MAFTDDEKLGIVEILGGSPDLLDAHFSSLGTTYLDRVEARVRTLIGLWDDGAGTKFTKIHPRERNYGVETFPEATRDDIRTRLARLLNWPFSYMTARMGTLQIG